MAILETIFCKIFGVISTILEKVGGEKITSCIHFNDNKHTLEENLQVLVSKASDIKTKVENVEVLGKKKRTTEVGKWMENVAKLKKDFDEIQEAGFCKPLMHGSHVKKLIEGVAELTKQCQTFHELLIDDGETSGVRLFPTRLHSKTLAEESDKMLEWLEAESDQVPCIGICGMGGVGKTTLAEYICKHLQDNAGGIYVYRLIVSQKVDINKLQKDLAKQLNCLDQVKEDDVEERASILNRVLIEKKNVVLLFDDVWKYFDLSKIGIPLGVNGCKVIMTSRLLQVCNQMGCNKYIVKLQPLSEEDAWKLFLEKLGCAYELSPEVEKVAKIMANKCDGLPLAIITLARSMSGVYGIHEWKDALEELNQSFMGQYDIKKTVLPILQHSYNRLRDSRWQQCFLYCSLYPEDSEMLIDELINQFIYEGLMDRRHSRAAEFDQGHTILNRLVNASLLESVDELKLEVKMHDLLREMAIEITRNNPRFMTKAGLQLHELPDEQEWTEDLDKVSLMWNKISEIPVNSSPRCPRLSTLIFSNNPLKLIPSSFFANMGGLKVLDLRDTYIEKLPNSLSELENLTALLLGGCRNLWYVPSLSKLKELRELDLSETQIKEVPDGMGCLVKLKCLKMRKTYKLVEISRGLIPRLSCLQCLILPDHVKIQAEELESLKLLEEFKGWVDDIFNSKWFNKSPPFNVYDIMVGDNEDDDDFLNAKDEEEEEEDDDFLNAKDEEDEEDDFFNEKEWEDDGMLEIYERSIRLEEYDFRKRGVDVLLLPKNTERLEIRHCISLSSCLRISSNSSHEGALQYLKCLTLRDLPNLIGLIKWEPRALALPPRGIFSSLERLVIARCHKVKKLLAHRLLVENLQNLKEIHVSDCKEIEEILADDKEDHEGVGSTSSSSSKNNKYTNIIAFPKLTSFELSYLPELESIYEGTINCCDSIEVIDIVDCPKLKRLAFFHASVDEKTAPPSASSSSSRSSNNSEYTNTIAFPKLRSIYLENLPELESIYEGTINCCDSIESIYINNCPKLKRLPFFHPSVDEKPNPLSASSSSSSYYYSGTPTFIFPMLEGFKLGSLPELKSICNGVMICDCILRIEVEGCTQLSRLPLFLPLIDGQPSPPPSLRILLSETEKDWWESLEWDHPNYNNVLRPFLIWLRH